MRVALSAPVVTVTSLDPVVVDVSILNVAVAVLAEFIVRAVILMPDPRLRSVIVGAKSVQAPVTVAFNVWPARPVLGIIDRMSGVGFATGTLVALARTYVLVLRKTIRRSVSGS